MKKPPPDMETVIRHASGAWSVVQRAETAMAERLRKVGGPHEHEVFLSHLAKAKSQLRAAYAAVVPRRRPLRRGPQSRLRDEPMHRCHYCDGLVWERDRRRHLRDAHSIDDQPWAKDDDLAAHYTLRNPAADDDDEEQPRSRKEDLDDL